ncbi:aminotransferase class I/II-fold pyridoxal phosphate-dependent enzyme [Bartonella sp. HY329]|uniref:aminotransferase class I/II-fold pyridoxal phosphate-dependent enzyme n=1 Tax=unclassified Bartonella TaxID=2645622 RepID=UPI0021C7B196|nr:MULTISPECIES: aminotransferase class I/II-fold pyridoxal phosphate-dependent enzyme [unclassified Bartonella]UXM94626.1 aminotransferase class I/II-fold pyridoxal phosphate-dependent enzyme [Bartonella sp. HY329]UXN08949.1 aminotransferase class I/II-fold pyridoxal phosphate-dependent enzyme [Bartonella sp. HY328]
MSYPKLLPHIDNIPHDVPFVGPETLERQIGYGFLARIGANESAFGPAPSVLAAVKASINDVWHYGDPTNFEIRQALANFYNIEMDNIAVDAGADTLLGLIVRQFVGKGDKVINCLGGYPTFNYHVTAYGGEIISVPYCDYRSDLQGLLEAAKTHHAKIVYLANPDNPLGSWHERGGLENFIDVLPENILLVLDEAYGETAPEGTLPSLLPLRPNVLRVRTFSKAYGLAGMRFGYVIGDKHLMSGFDRIRDHFSLSILTQKAALAALQNQDYLQKSVTKIIASRHRLATIAIECGFIPLVSATNFIAMDCQRGPMFAQSLLLQLQRRGVFIRKPAASGLDHLIRVSTAPDHIIDIFEEALRPAIIASEKEGELA